MRDMDTTATALVAAETGHLVIATCHTPNALQTVERIVSIFPENQQPQIYSQLANSLQGIIAQRLVPTADKKRRMLATELLMVNHAVRKHIRDKELHLLVNVIQMGRKTGMHLMDDSLLELYEAGEITYDTAVNYSHDPGEMRKKIHQKLQTFRGNVVSSVRKIAAEVSVKKSYRPHSNNRDDLNGQVYREYSGDLQRR